MTAARLLRCEDALRAALDGDFQLGQHYFAFAALAGEFEHELGAKRLPRLSPGAHWSAELISAYKDMVVTRIVFENLDARLRVCCVNSLKLCAGNPPGNGVAPVMLQRAGYRFPIRRGGALTVQVTNAGDEELEVGDIVAFGRVWVEDEI